MTSNIYDKMVSEVEPFWAVDVGNTSTQFAYYDGRRFRKTFSVLTNEVRPLFRSRWGLTPQANVVIASVVPPIGAFLRKNIRAKLRLNAYLIGMDLSVPIVNKYRNPKQVGVDRLLNAVAAYKERPQELIIVDFGTAITFDVVSKKGEYLGGAIVPGIRLSAEALFLKTALLPEINIRAPKNPIGKTTQDSILSGLFYGYGALCQGLIDLLAIQVKARPKVVMTGGHTQLMKKFVSPKIRIIDEHLVLKGLYLLAL